MNVSGIIRTSVDVNPFECIEKMCLEAGLIDSLNRVCCIFRDGKVYKQYYSSEYKKIEIELLYEDIYDVTFAKNLIGTYCLLKEYYDSISNNEELNSKIIKKLK